MKTRFLSIICAISVFFAVAFGAYAEMETIETEPQNTEEVSQIEEGEAADDENVPTDEPLLPAGSENEIVTEPEKPLDEEEAGTTVQVGLYYGSNAVSSANLQNAVGNGYRVGYMNEERQFQCLGYLDEIDVSVIKTENLYYGTKDGYTCYFDDISSQIAVGKYSILINTEIASFEETVAIIQSTEEKGYFPAWIEGVWQIRYGSFTNEVAAQTVADAMGGTVVSASGYGVSVVHRGTSDILFQFDDGSNHSLAVAPGADDYEQNVTWLKGNKYYGIFQYRRLSSGGNITISNFVSIDDYASCVASREMSSSWPMEALKAQTVCARSYYYQAVSTHRHKSQGFDICNTTHCQVYYGMASANERTAQASAETAELSLWYEGEPAEIFYYSSNGGASEDCKNVWVADRPYLTGVVDPYEGTIADKISGYHWSVTYTASELTELLHKKGYAVGANVVDLQVTELTPMGNVKRITFTLDNGKTQSFSKDNVRIFLGVKSIRYTISASQTTENVYVVDEGDSLSTLAGAYVLSGDGSVSQITEDVYVITSNGVELLSAQSVAEQTGTAENETVFTITGSGYGHNVGMSQWGAYAMAQLGYTFEDILKFYFTGIEIY